MTFNGEEIHEKPIVFCQVRIIWMAIITVVLGTNTQEAAGETITSNLPSQQELCSFYELSHLNASQYLVMIDICGDTITHVERER